MIIFPAIDLKDGKPVRLYQGDFSTAHVVSEDAIFTARSFKSQGAEYLHVVDLDGALTGKLKNLDIVRNMYKETQLPIELGGGIRDISAIEESLEAGVSRIILGTSALKKPELVKEAVKKFGDKIAVGIDAKDGYIAVEGWLKVSQIGYIDFAKTMEDIGVKTIIFTDISKDGTLQGPNLKATEELNQKVSCDIIASGGVKDIEDIKMLAAMNLYGAIAGKAIYSNSLSLKEAIQVGNCGKNF